MRISRLFLSDTCPCIRKWVAYPLRQTSRCLSLLLEDTSEISLKRTLRKTIATLGHRGRRHRHLWMLQGYRFRKRCGASRGSRGLTRRIRCIRSSRSGHLVKPFLRPARRTRLSGKPPLTRRQDSLRLGLSSQSGPRASCRHLWRLRTRKARVRSVHLFTRNRLANSPVPAASA